jgi:hypothetical protein
MRVAPPLTPRSGCDRQRFALICGQTWRNKCKHLGNSPCTYTSGQRVYPFMRWTHHHDLGNAPIAKPESDPLGVS